MVSIYFCCCPILYYRDKTYITILRQLLLDHHLSSNKKFRYSASNKELSGENGMDCSGRKHTYKSFYNYWSKYLFKNVNITWSMAVSRDQWFQYTKLMAPISRSTITRRSIPLDQGIWKEDVAMGTGRAISFIKSTHASIYWKGLFFVSCFGNTKK